jgi:ketoreductase RED1
MKAMTMNVTVIGGGLIGASWVALFLAHGHCVCVHDVSPEVEVRVRAELRRIQPFMAQLGLPIDPDAASLSFDAELASAVEQAQVVQECGPERLAFKQSLWARVEAHCKADALLLSSSSGITASMQARKMKTPERMLVGHPFNPPHLIPLVEVVPGRKTSQAAVERARAFYVALGKQAVVLNKEIPGFVANRIQAAVIRESVSLVRQGVVSVEDLDVAVQSSLGLRWATGGPFLSAHLGGGAGGIQAFWRQFAGGLQLLWLHMRLRPVLLTAKAQAALADGVVHRYGAQSIDELASVRDQQQIALLQALKTSATENQVAP